MQTKKHGEGHSVQRLWARISRSASVPREAQVLSKDRRPSELVSQGSAAHKQSRLGWNLPSLHAGTLEFHYFRDLLLVWRRLLHWISASALAEEFFFALSRIQDS